MVNPDQYDHVTLANEYRKVYGRIEAVQPVSTIQQLVMTCPNQFMPFLRFISFVQHDFFPKTVFENINYRLGRIEEIKYYRVQHNNKFPLSCCDVIRICMNGSYNRNIYDFQPMPKQDMDYLVGGLLLDYQRRKYRVCDRRLSLVKEQGESYTCEKYPIVKKKSSRLAISAINSLYNNNNNNNVNNNNLGNNGSSCENSNNNSNNSSGNMLRRGGDVNGNSKSVTRKSSGLLDDEFVKHSISYSTSTDYNRWTNYHKLKSISPEASVKYSNGVSNFYNTNNNAYNPGSILKSKSTRITTTSTSNANTSSAIINNAIIINNNTTVNRNSNSNNNTILSNLVKKKSSKIDVEQESSNSDDIVTNPVSRMPSKIEPFSPPLQPFNCSPTHGTRLPPIQSCQ